MLASSRLYLGIFFQIYACYMYTTVPMILPQKYDNCMSVVESDNKLGKIPFKLDIYVSLTFFPKQNSSRLFLGTSDAAEMEVN
jgi:hypothetical protein